MSEISFLIVAAVLTGLDIFICVTAMIVEHFCLRVQSAAAALCKMFMIGCALVQLMAISLDVNLCGGDLITVLIGIDIVCFLIILVEMFIFMYLLCDTDSHH